MSIYQLYGKEGFNTSWKAHFLIGTEGIHGNIFVKIFSQE